MTYEPAYETTVSYVVLQLVRNGAGVGLIDPYTAACERDAGVRIIPFTPTIPFNVALLRPDSRPASRAVDALLDLLATRRDAALRDLPR